MKHKRASGILMHPTSLPSRYGIGDIGPQAHDWIDILATHGSTLWQILPLGPTGYGDSPYQCLSAFAGNPYLVSPDMLLTDGLLHACAIGNTPPFTRLRLFNAAPKGRHVHSHHVQMRESTHFSVRFSTPPKYEVDGELWQAESTDVVVATVPGALQVVVPD
jgi:hypothetical protein